MSGILAPLHRALRHCEVELFSPHELAARCDDQAYVALLENPGEPSELGRYAYFCHAPIGVFRSKRSRCWGGPPGAEHELEGDPLDELAQLLNAWRAGRSTWVAGLPPFCGGAIGYLGYELLHRIEDIPEQDRDSLAGRAPGSGRGRGAEPSLALPDISLALFDLVFATDLIEQRSFVLATGFGETPAVAERVAAERLDQGLRELSSWRPGPARAAEVAPLRALAAAERARHPRLHAVDLEARGITATIDRAGYLASIARIQQEILDGNAFEVCLTQRFDIEIDPGELKPGARELYEVLRAVNPAPMSAYLRMPEAEILSASPERFVKLDRDGVVETRPIKGTRPRGRSEVEDLALAEHLRTAEKDRAENLMIVDLCRNDLGKVAQFGSVRVTELCGVHPYEFTWQMVSTIQAQLREGLGPVELLRACFPGGSMTGAPKIEAMKIIHRLEPTERGVFSGAIGLFDFDGAMDLAIVIRTLIRTGTRLSFHVGGAIVADSDPAEEYQETLDKAHGLVLALDLARARAREPTGG
jgi:para-aminobenzoate synthetase component 1